MSPRGRKDEAGDTEVADPAGMAEGADAAEAAAAEDLDRGQRAARRLQRAGALQGRVIPALQPLVSRWYFAVSALLFLCVVAVLGILGRGLQAGDQEGLLWLYGLGCPLSLLGHRLSQRHMDAAMAMVMVYALACIGISASVIGWGLSAPGLASFALQVCLASVVCRWRWALAITVCAALTLVGVHEAPDWFGLPRLADGGDRGPLRLGVHLLLLLAAAGCGRLIANVVERHVRSAHDREHRFGSLLAIAADAYWEIDEHYQLAAAFGPHGEPRTLSPANGLGRVPWELPQFGCDEETLDLLQADLGSRTPFRNLLIRWQFESSPMRWFMISGEPRFDARGAFAGYWGVARDVSDDVRARLALRATETRYQELFSRIPTPLVLHRGGRVIDANPAAVALFGYDSLGTMRGQDLLRSYESGDSRERERRRIEELDLRPAGEGLPVTDFRLSGRAGRRVSVRATSVRVDAEGGPAVLAIYVDDTERRAAEEAVRRSEAMLSHLVATSPDVITLTDVASGRFAMVNAMFEQLTGWRSDEVVGRTPQELGLWLDPDALEGFMARLRSSGKVQDFPTLFTAKGGAALSMLVSGALFAMDRREYLVVNARDVSAAEHTRLEREAILETASIGIAVTREQRFVLANPAFEAMYRWPHGALPGQPGAVVWPADSDHRELGERYGPALAAGEQVEFERTARRRDGSSFTARVLAKAIDPRHATRGGTIWIVEDVTERRDAERALSAALDQAESANRAKSAFLANTSHELRTPLHGMLGLADLARSPGLDEATRRLYLDQLSESAQTLTGIIADILDLSKIEAGKMALERARFDLGELLRSVHRAHMTAATARDLDLQLDLDRSLAGAVIGDPLRVRQIVNNYLGNAIKFTPRGLVLLRARRGAGDKVRIEVVDSGEGIDAQTQARLFRPFTQADESTTRRFGGTGLGLSICRELADLMAGSVGVDSTPGQGSCFWAELPLPAAGAESAPQPAPVDPLSRLDGARVLMVEDNAVNMLIAVAMLERWAVRVTQAVDGRQAVQAVEQAAARGEPFDAVLMDLQMPVMSGYEATRALRAAGSGSDLPIIALTAAALVGEREQAIDAGMDDFLTKPIDAEKLCTTLARWVSSGRR